MQKLDGWARIGIVISATWMLLTLCAASFELFVTRAPFGEFMFINFITSGPAIEGFTPVEPELMLGRTVTLMFAPVAAFWVCCLSGLATYRWVRAGFQR